MVAKDTGPLTWNIPIVTPDGRPTPEFQRRWETQRANNALIGTITFGVGAPTSLKPADGAFYVDTSTTPYTFYTGRKSAWHQVSASKFLDLLDVPHSYAAAGNKLVQVNSGATGLQFATLSSVLDSLGFAQGDILYRGASGWTILTPGTAGQLLQTGGAAANPSWAGISSFLDSLGNVQGDVLYRGASGWTVLAPGTAGQVLTTGGAGANPSWAAGGGGGGGHAYEAFGALPLAASFTHYNWQTGTTLTDGADSLFFNVPGQAAFNMQIAYKAAPTTPYDVYMRAKAVWWSGASRAGLCLFNSTTHRTLTIQWINATQIGVLDDTGPATFNAQFQTITGSSGGINWMRWHNDGTNLTPYISADGENWMQLGTATFAVATYAPDSYGIQAWNANATADPTAIWVGSLGTTAPA